MISLQPDVTNASRLCNALIARRISHFFTFFFFFVFLFSERKNKRWQLLACILIHRNAFVELHFNWISFLTQTREERRLAKMRFSLRLFWRLRRRWKCESFLIYFVVIGTKNQFDFVFVLAYNQIDSFVGRIFGSKYRVALISWVEMIRSRSKKFIQNKQWKVIRRDEIRNEWKKEK